ncbi:Transcriptional regulator, TetR family [gamma proteobacterium HdN1]|nr:Transcriptional regulator, TetR family [gamma proteobacterium HdN1]
MARTTMMESTQVNYRGRKTSRSRSEHRRRAILEAALRIVVAEGVRGVRHRAVAKEADVPLSATTYYFNDIHDLIADTFTLFAESAMTLVVDPIYEQAEQVLAEYVGVSLPEGEKQEFLAEKLSELLVLYIENEATEKRDHLLAEQAFMHECLRDPKLRKVAHSYFERMKDQMTRVCQQIGLNDPEIAGDLLMGAIFKIEFEALMLPPGMYDFRRARKTLGMLLRGLLAAPSPVANLSQGYSGSVRSYSE